MAGALYFPYGHYLRDLRLRLPPGFGRRFPPLRASSAGFGKHSPGPGLEWAHQDSNLDGLTAPRASPNFAMSRPSFGVSPPGVEPGRPCGLRVHLPISP